MRHAAPLAMTSRWMSALIVVETLDRARDSQPERGFVFCCRRGWRKRGRELYALSLHLVLNEL